MRHFFARDKGKAKVPRMKRRNHFFAETYPTWFRPTNRGLFSIKFEEKMSVQERRWPPNARNDAISEYLRLCSIFFFVVALVRFIYLTVVRGGGGGGNRVLKIARTSRLYVTFCYKPIRISFFRRFNQYGPGEEFSPPQTRTLGFRVAPPLP